MSHIFKQSNGIQLTVDQYNTVTGTTYSTTDPTGFVNTNNDSNLSFSAGNRTLTITPTGSTFDVMVRGKLYKKGTESIQIPAAEGLTHIAYNESGVLTNLGLVVGIDDFIKNNAYVCHIYWSTGTSTATGVGDERHGTAMDYETHKYLHLTRGAAYLSGFAPFGIDTTVAPSSDQAAVVGIEAGTFFDEDLRHDKLRVATGATIPVVYMSGATGKWRMNPPRIHPIMTGGTGGKAVYNKNTAGVWSVEEASNVYYVLYHIFGTNSIDYSVISLMGQAQYSTIALARAGATTEIANLVTNGLPTVEFIPIASIIFHTRDTLYTNQSKSVIVKTDTGENYVDWRTSKISPSSSASDHGSLAGLGDDDHLHYQTSARTETQLTGTVHTSITANTMVATGFTSTLSRTIKSATTANNQTSYSAFTYTNHTGGTSGTRTNTSATKGFVDNLIYSASGTASRWTGSHTAFESTIDFRSTSTLGSTPTIYAFKSSIDCLNAQDSVIQNSPVSITFTNPSVGQAWANGYFNVTAEGNSDVDAVEMIACFTSMFGTGIGSAIGYKGYATSLDTSHTGGLVGVLGLANNIEGATNDYVIGVNAAIAGSSLTPVARQMGIKCGGHDLITNGSLLVCSGSPTTPEDMTGTTGHLNFETGRGELFVQGKAEFDEEVFFDANESSSFTSVTGTYTAAKRTIILANGTFTVNLPAVSGLAGRKYTIKNTGSGTITVDGNASETIDTSLTQTLTANTVSRLICDGSTWWSI